MPNALILETRIWLIENVDLVFPILKQSRSKRIYGASRKQFGRPQSLTRFSQTTTNLKVLRLRVRRY